MKTQMLMLKVCVLLAAASTACDTARAPQPGAAADPVGTPSSLDPQSVAQRVGHSHPVIVEWRTVDSFEQLLGASDLVVEGTVVDRRFVNQRLYGYSAEKGRLLGAEEAGQEYTDLRLTESTVRIDRLARQSGRAAAFKEGDRIVVSELGGLLDDGCVATPDDKPLLERGDEVVLYLSSAGRPGVFHQVGGWQGRLYVDQGVVHPLAARVHPHEDLLMRWDGKSVDALLVASAEGATAPLPAPESPDTSVRH